MCCVGVMCVHVGGEVARVCVRVFNILSPVQCTSCIIVTSHFSLTFHQEVGVILCTWHQIQPRVSRKKV